MSFSFQHVHSDEVTSEEEEEEEMGEVTIHHTRVDYLQLMVRSHYILFVIDMLAAGHRPGPRPGPL